MWARIGSLLKYSLNKHLANASQVWVVARKRRPRWGGEGAGGCGHALAAFKYSLNT